MGSVVKAIMDIPGDVISAVAGGGGGGEAPPSAPIESSYQPEPAAPPPAAPAPEEIKTKAEEATKALAARKRRTVLTGPSGLLEQAQVTKKKLLGE